VWEGGGNETLLDSKTISHVADIIRLKYKYFKLKKAGAEK